MINTEAFKQQVERLQVVKGLSKSQISRRAKKNDGWLSRLLRSENVGEKTVHEVAKAMRVDPQIFLTTLDTKK